MAAVRADRLRARHARGARVGCGGVFAAEGDSRFLTRTLTACGYRRDQLGADLRRRLLAWGIMHRYSNLTWWTRRLPGAARSRHLRADVVRQDRTVARRLRGRVRAWPAPGRSECRLTAGLCRHGHRHEQDQAVGDARVRAPLARRGRAVVEAVVGGVRTDGARRARVTRRVRECPAGPRRRHGRVRPVRAGWLGPDRDGNAPAVARARLPAQRRHGRLPRARAARARGGPARAPPQLRGDPQRLGAPHGRRGEQRGGHAVCVRGVRPRPRESRDRPADRDDAGRPDPRRAAGGDCTSSTAGTGSSSRLAGQGAGATWRRRRMGIASSSAWPRRPGRQSPNSTAPTLLPPEPKRSATSGRTPDGSGRGSANLARRGSTIDQR